MDAFRAVSASDLRVRPQTPFRFWMARHGSGASIQRVGCVRFFCLEMGVHAGWALAVMEMRVGMGGVASIL